ncbi:hypothetical protein HID58_075999, partial [Brassica napus]
MQPPRSLFNASLTPARRCNYSYKKVGLPTLRIISSFSPNKPVSLFSEKFSFCFEDRTLLLQCTSAVALFMGCKERPTRRTHRSEYASTGFTGSYVLPFMSKIYFPTGRSSSNVQVWLLYLWDARNVQQDELMGVNMLLLDSQPRSLFNANLTPARRCNCGYKKVGFPTLRIISSSSPNKPVSLFSEKFSFCFEDRTLLLQCTSAVALFMGCQERPTRRTHGSEYASTGFT